MQDTTSSIIWSVHLYLCCHARVPDTRILSWIHNQTSRFPYPPILLNCLDFTGQTVSKPIYAVDCDMFTLARSRLTAWDVAMTPASFVTSALGGDARYDPTVLDNQQTSKQQVITYTNHIQ